MGETRERRKDIFGDMRIVIYLAGKYSGQVDQNIATAREYAVQLWEMGFAVFCPHLNTANFQEDCECKWEDYIAGDLAMLALIKRVFFMPGWEESRGSRIEHDFALKNNFKIYYSLEELESFMRGFKEGNR